MLVVMMMVLALVGLGITGLWLASGNLQVQANNNLRAQALYVAEAGVERARAALNSGGISVDALLAGASPRLDDVPTTVDAAGKPNGVGAIFMDAGTPLADVSFPPATFGRTTGSADAPTSATMGRYTVWIRNDTTECRVGQLTRDGNGTVVVRSRGVAADGLTTVVLEVALGATPATPGAAGLPSAQPPVLCVSGKNACDDNNSTVFGIVAQ